MARVRRPGRVGPEAGAPSVVSAGSRPPAGASSKPPHFPDEDAEVPLGVGITHREKGVPGPQRHLDDRDPDQKGCDADVGACSVSTTSFILRRQLLLWGEGHYAGASQKPPALAPFKGATRSCQG